MTIHQKLLQEFNNNGTRASLIDLPLLGAILALLVVGLVMVSSASMSESDSIYNNSMYILFKQCLFVGGGLCCMLFMLLVPVRKIQQHSWHSLAMGIGLLVLVLFFGREINGSVRWIPLGVFNLQASEAAKLCIVVYLADYLVRRLPEVRTQWIGFLKPLAVLIASAMLLLVEPDLGAVVVLMTASMGMIFMAGARKAQFTVLIILLGLAVGLLIWIEPYRMARLASYLDPWGNAFGSGYQLTQALIAFGRGEWFGVGLGNSIQKLFYLPEAHTDFVFAVLAEEFGVFGCTVVVLLFLFISWRILQIGFRCEQKGLLFHGYVAYGFALLFGGQALINIGVNTGLLPTKGLALPLISYGGSSLLINCLAFGFLLRIDYERRLFNVKDKPAEQRRRSASRGGRHV
ncbi:putative lipid II flippase FtsW [Endozoicomonas gorgoniicola]|uniref:Probable peptidoglycan glycosyltransferase FtsW n=1 Tax=Endozoicomonas gorgoniicola TaxID=1234144 RepID=A0ABT3MX67_9GAMM|nr:putative lipid II flippase FtsW [Endozoicomonas gorgoniicola]MCW7553574.1 putative lipid II flippase FtsW [Endozoicomonas gorgoniicola]